MKNRPKLSVVTTGLELDVQPQSPFLAAENKYVDGDLVISTTGLEQVKATPPTTSTAYTAATGVMVGGRNPENIFNPADLEFGEEIGRGASATVRLARYRKTTLVAVKQMRNLEAPNLRVQLMGEINSLYRTDCASIVKFYGAFLREKSVHIVLEYLDGGSLTNMMQAVGPVPEFVIANIAFQVLWGLAYLKHEKRLHRDIKPQNILINTQGQVKLTDFGVSKELSNTMAMGETYVGSFSYMAPERLKNEYHSFASDIYSLGVVLYELAMGARPFKEGGETFVSILHDVLRGAIPALPGPPRFTLEFGRIVANCLALDPQVRMTPEEILCHNWMRVNGALSLAAATENVRQWIASRQ